MLGRDQDHTLSHRRSRTRRDQVAARHSGGRRHVDRCDRRADSESCLGAAVDREGLDGLDDPEPTARIGQPGHDLACLAAGTESYIEDPDRALTRRPKIRA